MKIVERLKAIPRRKRIIFLVSILLLLVIVLFSLSYSGLIQSPLTLSSQRKVTVELKKAYGNPFAKDTQYVNPFQKYKNPFVVNK